MTRDELKALAQAMRKKSYSPYSHFAVGAALECSDGSVYTGCNIENAAYSPSICAERTAVAKAVSDGHTDFIRIAVAGSSPDFCTPCGVCRQVLQEFNPEIEVICLDGRGRELARKLTEFLPYSFGSDQLK